MSFNRTKETKETKETKSTQSITAISGEIISTIAEEEIQAVLDKLPLPIENAQDLYKKAIKYGEFATIVALYTTGASLTSELFENAISNQRYAAALLLLELNCPIRKKTIKDRLGGPEFQYFDKIIKKAGPQNIQFPYLWFKRAYLGELKSLQYLTKEDFYLRVSDSNEYNESNQNILSYACMSGKKQVVEKIFKIFDNIMKELAEEIDPIWQGWQKRKDLEDMAICSAISSNQLHIVKMLLDKYHCKLPESCMKYAWSLDMVKFLVARKAKILPDALHQILNQNVVTPELPEIIEFLVQSGVSVDYLYDRYFEKYRAVSYRSLNKRGKTIFHCLFEPEFEKWGEASPKNAELLNKIRDKLVQLNQLNVKDQNDNTAIFYAAGAGGAKYLLDKKAELNLTNKQNCIPLMVIRNKNALETILNSPLSADMLVDESNLSLYLAHAYAFGHLEKAKYLIDKGIKFTADFFASGVGDWGERNPPDSCEDSFERLDYKAARQRIFILMQCQLFDTENRIIDITPEINSYRYKELHSGMKALLANDFKAAEVCFSSVWDDAIYYKNSSKQEDLDFIAEILGKLYLTGSKFIKDDVAIAAIKRSEYYFDQIKNPEVKYHILLGLALKIEEIFTSDVLTPDERIKLESLQTIKRYEENQEELKKVNNQLENKNSLKQDELIRLTIQKETLEKKSVPLEAQVKDLGIGVSIPKFQEKELADLLESQQKRQAERLQTLSPLLETQEIILEKIHLNANLSPEERLNYINLLLIRDDETASPLVIQHIDKILNDSTASAEMIRQAQSLKDSLQGTTMKEMKAGVANTVLFPTKPKQQQQEASSTPSKPRTP